MSDTQTIDDVIEEHRQLVGAESVHLSLGPDATPENIREVLSDLREEDRKLNLFTDAERDRATIARMKKRFREISKLCQRRLGEDLTAEEADRRLREIFTLSDLVPDVSTSEDIAWMIADRQRRGQSLPVGL